LTAPAPNVAVDGGAIVSGLWIVSGAPEDAVQNAGGMNCVRAGTGTALDAVNVAGGTLDAVEYPGGTTEAEKIAAGTASANPDPATKDGAAALAVQIPAVTTV
jgi:hypothetical protein